MVSQCRAKPRRQKTPAGPYRKKSLLLERHCINTQYSVCVGWEGGAGTEAMIQSSACSPFEPSVVTGTNRESDTACRKPDLLYFHYCQYLHHSALASLSFLQFLTATFCFNSFRVLNFLTCLILCGTESPPIYVRVCKIFFLCFIGWISRKKNAGNHFLFK